MKNKNWIKGIILALIILPCSILFCACGDSASLKGKTFEYKSYSTAGYQELTAEQITVINSHITSVTSKETFVEYITLSLGTLTFTDKKVGTFKNDSQNFDYYAIQKNGEDIKNNYWGKTIQNSDSEDFVTLNREQIMNNGLTIYTSNPLDIVPEFMISIKNPEIADSELKMVVDINYISMTEDESFNANMTFFYQIAK